MTILQALDFIARLASRQREWDQRQARRQRRHQHRLQPLHRAAKDRRLKWLAFVRCGLAW